MLIRADCVRNWVVRFRILNWETGKLPSLFCGWKHWVGCALSGVCAGILLLACLCFCAIWWCLTWISSLRSFFSSLLVMEEVGGPVGSYYWELFFGGKAVVDSVSFLGFAFQSYQSVRPFISFYTSVTRDPCHMSGSSALFTGWL
jgi:hypothetical protein